MYSNISVGACSDAEILTPYTKKMAQIEPKSWAHYFRKHWHKLNRRIEGFNPDYALEKKIVLIGEDSDCIVQRTQLIARF